MVPDLNTTIRFEGRHHWTWIAQRLGIFTGRTLLIIISVMVLLIAMLSSRDAGLMMIFGAFTLAWITFGGVKVAKIYLEWRSRYIRLYSDGRLEYQYGVLKREGLSISLRLGAVRYFHNNLIEEYLDCANIVLPFDNGTLESIPNFRLFWEISQGRI